METQGTKEQIFPLRGNRIRILIKEIAKIRGAYERLKSEYPKVALPNEKLDSFIQKVFQPKISQQYSRKKRIVASFHLEADDKKVSNILKRNDIKKSEAYQSGFLEGTVPAYEAYFAQK
ncbi:MAG: hypothetical protein RR139_11385 [Lachnospiraceae bacterium]